MKKNNKKNLFKIVVLIFLVFIVYVEIANSSYLEIKSVEVNGNNQVQARDILKLLQVKPLGNLFVYSASTGEKNILQHPKIKKVFVKKIFPDKIKVQVYERKPKLQVQVLNKFLILDEEGWLMDVKNYPQTQLPKVLGLTIKNYKTGEVLKEDGVKVVLNCLENKEYLKPYSFNLIVFQDNRLTIYINGNLIKLGSTENLAKKFWVLSKLLTKINGKPIDYINIEAVKFPAVKYKKVSSEVKSNSVINTSQLTSTEKNNNSGAKKINKKKVLKDNKNVSTIKTENKKTINDATKKNTLKLKKTISNNIKIEIKPKVNYEKTNR